MRCSHISVSHGIPFSATVISITVAPGKPTLGQKSSPLTSRKENINHKKEKQKKNLKNGFKKRRGGEKYRHIYSDFLKPRNPYFRLMKGLAEVPRPSFKSEEGCLPRGLSAGVPRSAWRWDERTLSYFHLAVLCSRWGDSSSPWRSGNVGYEFFGSFTKVVKLGSKRRVCMFFLCSGLGGLCYHLWGRSSFVQSSAALRRWIRVVGCALLCELSCMSGCVSSEWQGKPGILQCLLTTCCLRGTDGLDRAMEKHCCLPSELPMLGVLCLLDPVGSSGFWEEIERSCNEEPGGREGTTAVPWDPGSKQGRFQDSYMEPTKNWAGYK